MRAIFLIDESFYDAAVCKFNPQNDRARGPQGSKKTDQSNAANLADPQARRAEGITVYAAMSQFWVADAHFLPENGTADKEYCADAMLATRALPKIRALATQELGANANWTYMRDLASSHTAGRTAKYLRRERANVLPWPPKGADSNPLDIFAWPSTEKMLKPAPEEARSAQSKLRVVLAGVIGNCDV